MKGKVPVSSRKIKWFIKSICGQNKIIAFKISEFTSSSKDLLPYSRIRVTTDSLFKIMSHPFLLYCSGE